MKTIVVEHIRNELLKIQTMNEDELRREWRQMLGTPAPPLSPAFLRRKLAYKVQEQQFGGLARHQFLLGAGHGLLPVGRGDAPVNARRGRSLAVGVNPAMPGLPALHFRARLGGLHMLVLGNHLSGQQENLVAEVAVLLIVDPENAAHPHFGKIAQTEIRHPELRRPQTVADGVAVGLEHLVVRLLRLLLVEGPVRVVEIFVGVLLDRHLFLLSARGAQKSPGRHDNRQ
ncbi:MAG: DUF2924 domain-containing protein [Clostridia bacterium]|nr:DUF2924 domain-containing protein [Clostridia bacterium]